MLAQLAADRHFSLCAHWEIQRGVFEWKRQAWTKWLISDSKWVVVRILTIALILVVARIVQYVNILKKPLSMKLSKIPPYPFSIRINLLATNSRIEGHSFPVRFAVGSLPPYFLP